MSLGVYAQSRCVGDYGCPQIREYYLIRDTSNGVEVTVLSNSRGKKWLTPLSPTQMECLRLLINTQNLDQIASALGMSTPHVEQQLDAACIRLGVQTPLEAAVVAKELGLISPP